MKKMFIVSSLLALFFVNTAVFADDTAVQSIQDEQSLSGTNLSSNNAKNLFAASPMDDSATPVQADTAGQTADDSDSW
jgi:hypothetical protein